MGDSSFYLIGFVILVVILIACIAVLIRNYMKLIARNDALMESVDNLCRLNDKLRMDRHDYLNHLQIVYGLMELEEYDEMNSYLRKVYKELLKTGKAVKTSKPASTGHRISGRCKIRSEKTSHRGLGALQGSLQSDRQCHEGT